MSSIFKNIFYNIDSGVKKMQKLIEIAREYYVFAYELDEIEIAYTQNNYHKVERSLCHMYELLKGVYVKMFIIVQKRI